MKTIFVQICEFSEDGRLKLGTLYISLLLLCSFSKLCSISAPVTAHEKLLMSLAEMMRLLYRPYLRFESRTGAE